MEQSNEQAENKPCAIHGVIGSCSQIATKLKKVGSTGIYSDEECGNKAKIEIEYTLNNKLVNKKLCMKHYKSVTKWLDRIKVSYNCL